MAERKIKAEIGYTFDATGGKAFLEQNSQIDRSVENLRTHFRRSSEAAETMRRDLTSGATAARLLNKEFDAIARERAFEQLTSDVQLAVREGRNMNDVLRGTSMLLTELGAKEGEIRQVARAIEEANRGGAKSGQGALGRAGRELFLLPDIGIPGLGGFSTTELSRGMVLADTVMQKLTLTTGQLVAGLGVGVPIVAGLALIFAEASRRAEELKERLEAFVQGLTTQTELVTSGATTADVEQQRDRAQVFFDAFNDQLTELVSSRERLLQLNLERDTNPEADAEISRIMARLNEIVPGAGDSFQFLEQTIGVVRASTDEYGIKLASLNDILASGALAVNDQLEAARAYIETTRELTKHEMDLERLRRTGTTEGVRQQIDDNLHQIDVLYGVNQAIAEQIEQNQGNAGVVKALTNEMAANAGQMNDLVAVNRELEASVLPLIEAREREKAIVEGLTDLYDQQLNTLEQEGKTRAEIEKLTAQAAVDLAEQRQKLADIQTQLNNKLDDIADKQVEIETTSAERRTKIMEEARKAIEKIERKLLSDRMTAIGNRDALEYYQATQKAKEQLSEVKERGDEQQQELERQTDKQLAELQKQRDNAEAAMQDATQREMTRWQQETSVRDYAYAVLQTQLQNFVNAQIALANQLATTRSTLSSTGSPLTPGQGTWQTITLPNGAQQPGFVVPYTNMGAMGQGTSVNPTYNIIRSTPQQTRQEMDRHTEEVLKLLYGQSSPR